MTLRSLICFSLVAISAIRARPASVSGSVQLRDTKHRDCSGVVISLTPATPVSPVTRAPRHAVMLQKNKMFTPHVLPVLTGTVVDFPNADPIFHNAFSRYEGQIFDIGLYPPGGSRSVRFNRPGTVRVFCNIHPSMSAVIVVLATPYFATTKADGSFSLDAPPGPYELNVFHERATEQELQAISRLVLVREEGLRLDALVISEAGRLMTSHKNKYGRDYSSPDDQVYPGVRN